MSENGKISYRQKLHEPILNPIQIIFFAFIVIFEVVSNLLPILMGWGLNPIWIMATIIIGIVSFAVLSLMRAAYPEIVPDTRILVAFQMFIKQVIDALISNKEEKSDLKSLLERIMVWSVREWDVIYQMELEEAIAYAKSRLEEQTKVEPEPLATAVGYDPTDTVNTT